MRRMLVSLSLTLALLLVPAALAQADAAFEQVAAAFATGGGHLDPCQFTQAQLEAAAAGIPQTIKDAVPDLRKAMQDGITAHQHGDCNGREPGSTTTPTTPAGSAVPPVTTTPTAPATTPGSVPPQTTPTATTPAPANAATPSQPAASGPRTEDRTALVVALIALGSLLLLVLAAWAWARLRGWDPPWAARTRHAWGEAGFRTTTTWSEFTDWLRLGR